MSAPIPIAPTVRRRTVASRDGFEFMDQAWLPRSLRLTLRDALDCTLSVFRKPAYYDHVAAAACALARDGGSTEIVELGAGSAPITRRLAARADLDPQVRLRVTDLVPDTAAYDALERRYPGRVVGCREAVDFLRPLPFGRDALLIFSASFHHIPRALRPAVLENLRSHRVLVAEPIQRRWWIMFANLLLVLPVLFTPVRGAFERDRGRLRRLLWCWLVPVAAPLLIWDGIVSCWRCWTPEEWRAALADRRHHRIRIDATGMLVDWWP